MHRRKLLSSVQVNVPTASQVTGTKTVHSVSDLTAAIVDAMQRQQPS